MHNFFSPCGKGDDFLKHPGRYFHVFEKHSSNSKSIRVFLFLCNVRLLYV